MIFEDKILLDRYEISTNETNKWKIGDRLK